MQDINISVLDLPCSDICYELGNHRVELILFQQALSPEQSGDFRVFSFNNLSNKWRPHHVSLKAQLIQEESGSVILG